MMNPAAWFTNFQEGSDAPFRLFAFPFAGGGAAIYRQWAKRLPGTEVLGVRLPGREARIREPAISSMNELIDALALAISPLLDRPYALFGHSFGALVSFELAHRMRLQGKREPSCLLVSAFRSPDRRPLGPALHRLPDVEFMHELNEYGGLPQQILESPEILQLVVPALRADFAVFEMYKYEPRAPLDCPIVGFCGMDDHLVPASEMFDWVSKTSGDFKLHKIDGRHFFVASHETELLTLVATSIRPYQTLRGMHD